MIKFEIDWKNFTVNQLIEKLKGTGVYVAHENEPLYNPFWKKNANTPLTISDHGLGEIQKGSENLYLEFNVYPVDGFEEYKMEIYTKDDHETLKAIAKSFIDKMKDGGSVDDNETPPKGEDFSPEWNDYIKPYFEKRNMQVHWISEDDNWINYNVTDNATGKTTPTTEVMKKKLWNLPVHEVAEEMYNFIQDKFVSYFKEGGSTGMMATSWIVQYGEMDQPSKKKTFKGENAKIDARNFASSVEGYLLAKYSDGSEDLIAVYDPANYDDSYFEEYAKGGGIKNTNSDSKEIIFWHELKPGYVIIDPTTKKKKEIERVDSFFDYINIWYTDGIMKRYSNKPHPARFTLVSKVTMANGGTTGKKPYNIADIKEMIPETFNLQEEEGSILYYHTSEYGSPSSDEPSEQDIESAKTLAKSLLQTFDNMSINIDHIDEYVTLKITPTNKKIEPTEIKLTQGSIKSPFFKNAHSVDVFYYKNKAVAVNVFAFVEGKAQKTLYLLKTPTIDIEKFLEKKLLKDTGKEYEWKEISVESYNDAVEKIKEHCVKSKFSSGGTTTKLPMTIKDAKYDITYTVQKSPTRADRWEVVSESPNWEKPSIEFFVSDSDAINHANILAGKKSEQDPEKRFLWKQEMYKDGGTTEKFDIMDRILINAVYNNRLLGIEGRIGYYKAGASRYFIENGGNISQSIANLEREQESVLSDKKHFSQTGVILDLHDESDAKKFLNELNGLANTRFGEELFRTGKVKFDPNKPAESYYDRYLKLYDRLEEKVEELHPGIELFAGGGVVATSIKDIPNLEERLAERRITYRGMGMGKKSSDFYKANGEGGTLITVDGKEYAITDSEFKKLDWDEEKGEWKRQIRFKAPTRKAYKEGGTTGFDFGNSDITPEEFNHRLELAKTQLLEDMQMGEVPVSVKSFRELHFYVDANYYGGFFDEGYEMSEGFAFENAIQDAMDDYIKKGGHVQLFLAKEAVENKFDKGGVVVDRDELREKLERVKDLWHDFSLTGDTDELADGLRTIYAYLTPETLTPLENLDDEPFTWEKYNEAWDDIFKAFTAADDQTILNFKNEYEKYLDESLDGQEEFGNGGYTRPSATMKIAGEYQFVTPSTTYRISVAGFERENDDSDSLYLMDADNTKAILGSIIVKNNALKRLSKGDTITGVSSKTGEKGKLTRWGDL